ARHGGAARGLHRGRNLGRHAAHGRDEGVEGHHRHKQGCRGPDHEDGRPRRGRRRAQDRARADRRRQSQEGLTDRQEAESLLAERIARRRERDFAAADEIRERLRAGGWEVLDGPGGSELQALKPPPASGAAPVARAVTLLTVVHGWLPDVERWLLSVFTHCKADFEALLVDNSGDTRMAGWLESRAAERLRSVTLDPRLGFSTAVNAGIQAAAGEVIVLFDPGVELTGDAISLLIEALEDPTEVVAGPFGLRGKGTLKEFEEDAGPDVDAIEGYCMAFRRSDASAVDGFDPKF